MENFKHILFDEVFVFGCINSTIAKSQKLLKEEQANGNFLVVSRSQKSGHGRNKNAWFSPDGGIYMSANLLGLSPDPALTLFMGISIHKAIAESFPYIKKDLHIKWPNDLYLDGKKICGILSQHLPKYRYHSFGIGINTNIDEFPDNLKNIAISLFDSLHFQIDNKKLITKIFDIFSHDFPKFIENGLDLEYYNKFSLLKDKEVTIDTDFAVYSGVCRGINKNGAIVLQLPSKMNQPFFGGSIVDWK
jgi:BirA family biotin operon repressor/biotin-[acetyl-CoA-carboxylase] ligase